MIGALTERTLQFDSSFQRLFEEGLIPKFTKEPRTGIFKSFNAATRSELPWVVSVLLRRDLEFFIDEVPVGVTAKVVAKTAIDKQSTAFCFNVFKLNPGK